MGNLRQFVIGDSSCNDISKKAFFGVCYWKCHVVGNETIFGFYGGDFTDHFRWINRGLSISLIPNKVQTQYPHSYIQSADKTLHCVSSIKFKMGKILCYYLTVVVLKNEPQFRRWCK